MEKLLRNTLINGRFKNVSKARSHMMQAVKSCNNKTTEVQFCAALIEAGIQGWETQSTLVGNPDVLFPFYKIAVFLDGCFWHYCPTCGHVPKTNTLYWQTKLARNQARDAQKAQALENEGYTVVRFWEHEIINGVENCVARLQEQIEDYLNSL